MPILLAPLLVVAAELLEPEEPDEPELDPDEEPAEAEGPALLDDAV